MTDASKIIYTKIDEAPLRLGSAAAGARSAAGSPTPLAHPAPARGEKVRL